MLTRDGLAAEVLENSLERTVAYPKAVVALAGARDHYQLPLAFKKLGSYKLLSLTYISPRTRSGSHHTVASFPKIESQSDFVHSLAARRFRSPAMLWARKQNASRWVRKQRFFVIALMHLGLSNPMGAPCRSAFCFNFI